MRLSILRSLRFSTLWYVLVELQHAHLFRKKTYLYLSGMSIQKASVCCTGGARCGTEGVWDNQASSLSPGKRREQEASDQSGCSREPLRRWKVNHHCSTKLSFMTEGGVSSAKDRQRPGLKLLALILTSCLKYLR